jgi:hypothetical protein
VRAKKAASGTRPVSQSSSTHASVRPQMKKHMKAMLFLPWAEALVATSRMPSRLPSDEYSRSSPDRSLAFTMHSSAIDTYARGANNTAAGTTQRPSLPPSPSSPPPHHAQSQRVRL